MASFLHDECQHFLNPLNTKFCICPCADLKVNICIENPHQPIHFFDPFSLSMKNYDKTMLFSTWVETNVEWTKPLIPKWSFHNSVCFASVLSEGHWWLWSTMNQCPGTSNPIFCRKTAEYFSYELHLSHSVVCHFLTTLRKNSLGCFFVRWTIQSLRWFFFIKFTTTCFFRINVSLFCSSLCSF